MPSSQSMSNLELESLVTPFTKRVGGLIQALRAIMQKEGWIDPDSLPVVASVFNKSVAEIRGVVSFYADFRLEPPKKTRIRVCQAESCQALGLAQLMQALKEDGLSDGVDLEMDHVYCLGVCPLGPAVEVNGRLIAEATVQRIQAEIE